jgi:hypothetical protein
MEEAASLRFALYYPFIQFRSDSWLKVAALYWDRIGRIVPPGYLVEDSFTVQQLNGELDLISDLAPSGDALDAVSTLFLDMLRVHGRALQRMYGVNSGMAFTNSDDMLFPTWGNYPAAIRPAPGHWNNPKWTAAIDPSISSDMDGRLSYIYSSGKMTPEMEAALVDADLGILLSHVGLIGMHPQLAFIYMHSLASIMASSLMHPLTEDDFDHVALGCMGEDLLEILLQDDPLWDRLASRERLQPAFAMIAVRSVIPKDIASIPVEKIIEIRCNYSDELAMFQNAVTSIVSKVPDAIRTMDANTCAGYLDALYDKTLKVSVQRASARSAR